MEGEGAYCYKCKVYRSNSWDKLHTHLRCRCLNAKEKALLVNSYVHVQAKREFRLKAQAKRKTTMICVILGLVGWAWLVLFLRWGRRGRGGGGGGRRPKKYILFFRTPGCKKFVFNCNLCVRTEEVLTRPIESWC